MLRVTFLTRVPMWLRPTTGRQPRENEARKYFTNPDNEHHNQPLEDTQTDELRLGFSDIGLDAS